MLWCGLLQLLADNGFDGELGSTKTHGGARRSGKACVCSPGCREVWWNAQEKVRDFLEGLCWRMVGRLEKNGFSSRFVWSRPAHGVEVAGQGGRRSLVVEVRSWEVVVVSGRRGRHGRKRPNARWECLNWWQGCKQVES